MNLIKIGAGIFFILSIVSFLAYLITPFILNAILGQDACGAESEIAYQSCIAIQKAGHPIGCIGLLCQNTQHLFATAGSVFAFISACCGVYRIFIKKD